MHKSSSTPFLLQTFAIIAIISLSIPATTFAVTSDSGTSQANSAAKTGSYTSGYTKSYSTGGSTEARDKTTSYSKTGSYTSGYTKSYSTGGSTEARDKTTSYSKTGSYSTGGSTEARDKTTSYSKTGSYGSGNGGRDSSGQGNGGGGRSFLTQAGEAISKTIAQAKTLTVEGIRTVIDTAYKVAGRGDTVRFAGLPQFTQPTQPKQPENIASGDQKPSQTDAKVPDSIVKQREKDKNGGFTDAQMKKYDEMNREEAKRKFNIDLAMRRAGVEVDNKFDPVTDPAYPEEGIGDGTGLTRRVTPEQINEKRIREATYFDDIPTKDEMDEVKRQIEEDRKNVELEKTYFDDIPTEEDTANANIKLKQEAEAQLKRKDNIEKELARREVDGEPVVTCTHCLTSDIKKLHSESLNKQLEEIKKNEKALTYTIKKGEGLAGTQSIPKSNEELAKETANRPKDRSRIPDTPQLPDRPKPGDAGLTKLKLDGKVIATVYPETGDIKPNKDAEFDIPDQSATMDIGGVTYKISVKDGVIDNVDYGKPSESVNKKPADSPKTPEIKLQNTGFVNPNTAQGPKPDGPQAKVNKALTDYNTQLLDQITPEEKAAAEEYAKKLNEDNLNLKPTEARLGPSPELVKETTHKDNDLNLTNLKYWQIKTGNLDKYNINNLLDTKDSEGTTVSEKISSSRLPIFGRDAEGNLARDKDKNLIHVRDKVTPYLKNLTTKQKRITAKILTQAGIQGVDYRTALAIGAIESKLGIDARTYILDCCTGVMQVGKAAFDEAASKEAKELNEVFDIKIGDDDINIQAGVAYIKIVQAALVKKGIINPTIGDVYGCYQQGMGGCSALIKYPDLPAPEALAKGTKYSIEEAREAVVRNKPKGADVNMKAKEFRELIGQYPTEKLESIFKLNQPPPKNAAETEDAQIDEDDSEDTAGTGEAAGNEEDKKQPANLLAENESDHPIVKVVKKAANLSPTVRGVVSIFSWLEYTFGSGTGRGVGNPPGDNCQNCGDIWDPSMEQTSVYQDTNGDGVLSTGDKVIDTESSKSGRTQDPDQSDKSETTDASQFTPKQNVNVLVNNVFGLTTSNITAFIPSPDYTEAKSGLIRRITTTIKNTTYVVELHSKLNLSEKFIVVKATQNGFGSKVTFTYTDNGPDGSLDAFSANGVNLTGSSISNEVKNKFTEELRTLTNLYYKSL